MRTVCSTLLVSVATSVFVPGVAAAADPQSAPAIADPAQLDVARIRAENGGKLYDAGKYAEALDELNSAYAVVQVPTVELYIARCQMKLGKLREAKERYQHAASATLASDAGQQLQEAKQAAERELRALEPQIPRIHLIIDDMQMVDLSATLDENLIVPLNAPAEVNPGRHVVVVSKRGRTVFTQSVTAVLGKTQEVIVSVAPESSPKESSSHDTAPTGPPMATTGAPHLRAPTWILLGAGFVGIGAGTVTGVIALIQHGQVASRCDGNNGCVVSDRDLAESGAALATASTTSFVLGGLASAAGAALLLVQLVRGRSAAEPPKVSLFNLRPAIGPGGAALSGEF